MVMYGDTDSAKSPGGLNISGGNKYLVVRESTGGNFYRWGVEQIFIDWEGKGGQTPPKRENPVF